MSKKASIQGKVIGTLQISPKHARFKKDKESFGKMDPYLTLELDTQKFQTKVAKDEGKYPKWKDSFTFEITEDILKLSQPALVIKAADWDTKKNKHSFDIGAGLILLTELLRFPNEEIMKEMLVYDKEQSVGTIDFEVEFRAEAEFLDADGKLALLKAKSPKDVKQLPGEDKRLPSPKDPHHLHDASGKKSLSSSKFHHTGQQHGQGHADQHTDQRNTNVSLLLHQTMQQHVMKHVDQQDLIIEGETSEAVSFRPSQAQKGGVQQSSSTNPLEQFYNPEPRVHLRGDYQAAYEKALQKQLMETEGEPQNAQSKGTQQSSYFRPLGPYIPTKTQSQLDEEKRRHLAELAKEYDYSRLLKPAPLDEKQTQSQFALNFKKFTLVVRPRGVDLPGRNNEANHMNLHLLVFVGDKVFETRQGTLEDKHNEFTKNFVVWTDSLSCTVEKPTDMFRIFLVDENLTKQDADDTLGSFEQSIEAIDELFSRTNNRVASFDLTKKGRVIGTVEVELERKEHVSVGATTHLPTITIPRGQALFKKVIYENSEKVSKTLELRSSRPELLSVEEPLIIAGPVRKIHIRVCVYAPLTHGEEEVKLDIFCVENNCVEESIIFTLRSIY